MVVVIVVVVGVIDVVVGDDGFGVGVVYYGGVVYLVS